MVEQKLVAIGGQGHVTAFKASHWFILLPWLPRWQQTFQKIIFFQLYPISGWQN